MSDFDDYDDLDAVRDFRVGAGLLTPEVDERIRRRIVDLAIARGLAHAPGTDEAPDPDVPGEEGSRAGAPVAPTGAGSSDGSAASVVELHAAARPPAHQPRVLVAVAAIALVVVVGALLVVRDTPANLDTAVPPASADHAGPDGLAPRIASIDDLRTVLGSQPHRRLGDGEMVRTVDRRTQREVEGPGASDPGTFSYTLTQERTRNGFRRYDVTDSTFRSVVGDVTVTSEPPTAKPTEPFANRSYDDVQALADLDVEQLRTELLRDEGRSAGDYRIVVNALNLVRLPITPPATRARLVDVLTTGAYALEHESVADGAFAVRLRNRQTDETVSVRFDVVTADVLGWERSVAGVAVETLESLVTPQVLR